MQRIVSGWILCFLLLGLVSGCSITHKPTQTSRTAIEQLLLSEAVGRSLTQPQKSTLRIPRNSTIILNTSGMTGDQDLVYHMVVAWLGQLGIQVVENEEHARYRVNVIVESLGTELGGTFFGMPPVQSVLLPFSLPELAIFKAQYQTGYVKYYLDVFELPTNRYIQSTPPFWAESYYNDYTVLFLFSFFTTDLMAPPYLGSFHEEEEPPLEEKRSTMERQGDISTPTGE